MPKSARSVDHYYRDTIVYQVFPIVDLCSSTKEYSLLIPRRISFALNTIFQPRNFTETSNCSVQFGHRIHIWVGFYELSITMVYQQECMDNRCFRLSNLFTHYSYRAEADDEA